MGSEELQMVFAPEPLPKTEAEQRRDVLRAVNSHMNKAVVAVMPVTRPETAPPVNAEEDPLLASYPGMDNRTWYPEMDFPKLKPVAAEAQPTPPTRVNHARDLQLGYVSVNPMVLD